MPKVTMVAISVMTDEPRDNLYQLKHEVPANFPYSLETLLQGCMHQVATIITASFENPKSTLYLPEGYSGARSTAK